MKMDSLCLTTWHGSRRNCARSWQVPLYSSICGASKGGYTTSSGTDRHSQMWRNLFVSMATLSLRWLFCYPNRRKSHGTCRHSSVNRTDTQTSKVLTMQMMMTLILTTSLRVKTNTDWMSSMVLNEECLETVNMHKYSIYWNCQYIHVYSSITYVLEYSSIVYKNTGYIYSVLVWKYA